MEYLTTNVHPLLNSKIITFLNDIKVFSILDFLNCENKQIEKITSLTLKEILEIKKALLKKYSRPKTAYNYYQNILTTFAIIPTGISKLDNLLEGGLFTGNIYEICGLPASGKTLFCLTLLKHFAPKSNEIMYLDTKHDFSGLKLKQMMSHLKKDELILAMNKILVHNINSKQHFLKVLLRIKYAVQNGNIVNFIIIDSLPPLSFSSSDQNENNAFLSYTANILHYLAKEHNVIIIVTNLITLWNDGDFKNVDVMKERISCGSFWHNVPNVRIVLRKNKDVCKMNLTKTIKFIPENNSCSVMFADEGLI